MRQKIADYMKWELLPVDVQEADEVELEYAADGRVWLNVDGVCVFRCNKVARVSTKPDKDKTFAART